MKNLKIKINQIFKDKYSVYYISVALVVVFLVILFAGQDTKPTSIFYPVDRLFEKISFNQSTTAKIEKELKLATERIDEVKYVITDETDVKNLLNDFSTNLTNINNYYNSMVGGVSQEELYDEYNYITLYYESLTRSLTVRFDFAKENISDEDLSKSIRREIQIAFNNLNKSKDDLFDTAINNITDIKEFDTYARTQLVALIRVYSEQVGYDTEDVPLVKNLISEEEYAELEALLNESREQFYATRDLIGQKSNLEVYNEFLKVGELQLKLSQKLVDITQNASDTSESAESAE